MDIAVVFILGTCIGSFTALSIYRIPLGESIWGPRSYCPHCKAQLKARDLIPVLSWLWQRGKCRYCLKQIGGRELFVEVLSGSLYVALYWKLGNHLALYPAFAFTHFLLLVAFIDYEYLLIFDEVMQMMLWTGILFQIIFSAIHMQAAAHPVFFPLWTDSLLGFLGGGILMFLLFIGSGEMGLGDVWFTAVAGFWLGPEKMLLMLFLSFFFGGGAASLSLLFGSKQRKDYMAFGPFLAAAAFFSCFYGDQILHFYWNLLR